MFRAGVVGLISMVALPVFASTAERQTEFLAKAQTTEVWSPEPVVVSPGLDGAPPSDAVVLFDGSDFDAWVGDQGGEPAWRLIDGAMEVVKGTGDIRTKQAFADIQLHIEWATPSVVTGESQGRGNSGVFLMGDMKCRCWTPSTTAHTAMARQAASTNNTSHWSTRLVRLVSGRAMTSFSGLRVLVRLAPLFRQPTSV